MSLLFQSTPPRGWRRIKCEKPWEWNYFNPLHREGGDPWSLPSVRMVLSISIHSTARVETKYKNPERIFNGISIHSTARVETEMIVAFHCCTPISIHSTARVETLLPGNREWLAGISIHSTARVETLLSFCPVLPEVFQSTPPRGWRHLRAPPRPSTNNFNPLHREGGDI